MQANGLDERFNQTLQNMLIKYVHEKHENWDQFLDTCIFAYNTSVQESTKYCPFELMFGRKATLPIDLEFENRNALEEMKTATEFDSSEVETLFEKRKELIEAAKSNIIKAQQKQKEAYDRKHARPEGFKVIK